ncbi:MAG TPA: protein translocase subunit SecF [Methanomicrobiales archaeon]|nr:protein translocase subunit SecF [Methanomicrobiales archaeon]
MGSLTYDVNRYTPKQMIVIPAVVLMIALVLLAFNTMHIGLPVKPGIDFAGGTAVTLYSSETELNIMTSFADFPLITPIEGSPNNGYYLKFEPMSDDQLQSLITLVNDKYPNAKIDQIGETFGKTLQQQALIALLISFIGMSIVVFIAFRTVVPSFAVVLSAFADIAITAAIMDLLGITLSLGTTAALLMLIGYSVDSDILLTNRVLKRKGNLDEKLAGAYHTGIIMTTTTLAALGAMWVVSFLGQIEIILEIASVLIIGLMVDLMNTWLTNAGILKWYARKRGDR